MKIVALASGKNRYRNLSDLGRRENEYDIRRRFLKRLKQRVERTLGQHVNLINDVHFILSLRRSVTHFFDNFANIVDAVVGSGVDLDHIHRVSCRYLAAGSTFITGIPVYRVFTVHDLRHDLGDRRLAGSSCTAE